VSALLVRGTTNYSIISRLKSSSTDSILGADATQGAGEPGASTGSSFGRVESSGIWEVQAKASLKESGGGREKMVERK
jgi:hypothetical protein